MIVAKAVNMAKKMNVPILGIVENMSYLECPDCGKHIDNGLVQLTVRIKIDIHRVTTFRLCLQVLHCLYSFLKPWHLNIFYLTAIYHLGDLWIDRDLG